jgi:hypothetical protein
VGGEPALSTADTTGNLAVKDLDPQVLTIILARETLAPLANRYLRGDPDEIR